MNQLLNVGEAVGLYAHLYPDKLATLDSRRALTFRQWNERACRLANALLGLGLDKGDRVAMLAYNCLEWSEFYVAMAKSGLVAVPINFRLTGPEIRYIVENCEARALVVQDDLCPHIEEIHAELGIDERCYIHFGGKGTPPGYTAYESLLTTASPGEPEVEVAPDDPWAFMYTSGTTGKPKGAIRDHASGASIALITELDMGFTRDDSGLLVMPMCHANSFFFFSALAYCGATCYVYDRQSFDPENLLVTLASHDITFTSLVPTQYIMMLGLEEKVKRAHTVTEPIKLMISSAPARRETKQAIMEQFPSCRLFELYGSSEAGWVTLLRPDEQIRKLGSIGREWTGTGRVRLLDDNGEEVPDGEVGELYSRTPYTFRGYWKLPEKTAEAFRGNYCTVNDLARRDQEGYYHLVDRKSNMIISGGENVYPSEVEDLLAPHPKIGDLAVIGLPHEKWGESVHAVVILREGQRAEEAEILEWCKDKMAGYKRPRSVSFIRDDEMPRTATGKTLHRKLRERYIDKG